MGGSDKSGCLQGILPHMQTCAAQVPTSSRWRYGVLGILARWPAQQTLWAGASCWSRGEHRALQAQPAHGGCEDPHLAPHSLLPFHSRVLLLVWPSPPSLPQQPVKGPFMAGPGAHGFPWAIQNQQAWGQLQSSWREAPRALLPSTLPSTHHLPKGLHILATGAPGSFCQPCAMAWLRGPGASGTGGLGDGAMGWPPPPFGIQ